MGLAHVLGKVHRARAFTPWFVMIAGMIVLRVCIPYMSKTMQVRLYPTLVTAWVVSLHIGVLWLGFVRELTRAAGGGVTNATLEGPCARTSHISVTTDFSTLLPTRTCIDRNPKLTLTDWPFIQAPILKSPYYRESTSCGYKFTWIHSTGFQGGLTFEHFSRPLGVKPWWWTPPFLAASRFSSSSFLCVAAGAQRS